MQQPHHTLYLSNIDWSIKKPVLRRALYTLFSRHGKILDVVALRKDGLRGQAWIIFEDVAAATAALQADQGFEFFGRGLKIAYANDKSDRIAKMEGTYKPRKKRPKLVVEEQQEQEQENGVGVEGNDGSNSNVGGQVDGGENDEEEEDELLAPPSKILFAKDVPAECNEMMLSILFRQYPGFQEVRVPRQGLAFAEYENEVQASVAFKALNRFKLTNTEVLKLNYAKV